MKRGRRKGGREGSPEAKMINQGVGKKERNTFNLFILLAFIFGFCLFYLMSLLFSFHWLVVAIFITLGGHQLRWSRPWPGLAWWVGGGASCFLFLLSLLMLLLLGLSLLDLCVCVCVCVCVYRQIDGYAFLFSLVWGRTHLYIIHPPHIHLDLFSFFLFFSSLSSSPSSLPSSP